MQSGGDGLSGRFGRVSHAAAAGQHEVVCPHCKKAFEPELLAGGSRHEGFKCPHCRLFVPAERADGDAAAQA
jgi:hypothetical protein